MNRREDIFGYLLPLDPGTNVILLTASDATTNNLSAQVVVVERSTKYQAAITAPALGAFANGTAQTASGTVSAKFDDGSTNGLGIAGVSINGVAATLGTPDGNGMVAWNTGGTAINLDGTGTPNCSVLPTIMRLCWTNAAGQSVFPGVGVVTNNCPQIPLGLLEGYEVLSQCNTGQWSGVMLISPNYYGCADWSVGIAAECSTGAVSYVASCDTGSRSSQTGVGLLMTGGDTDPSAYGCYGSVAAAWAGVDAWTNWVACSGGPGLSLVSVSERGLVVGTSEWQDETDWYFEDDGSVGEIDVVPQRLKTVGSLQFTAPFYYPANTLIIFTLEGVSVNGGAPGTNLLYQGQSPVTITNDEVSYLITVTGGRSTRWMRRV